MYPSYLRKLRGKCIYSSNFYILYIYAIPLYLQLTIIILTQCRRTVVVSVHHSRFTQNMNTNSNHSSFYPHFRLSVSEKGSGYKVSDIMNNKKFQNIKKVRVCMQFTRVMVKPTLYRKGTETEITSKQFQKWRQSQRLNKYKPRIIRTLCKIILRYVLYVHMQDSLNSFIFLFVA